MWDSTEKKTSGQSVWICVDAYRKGNPVGRLYHLCKEQETVFDSLLQCLQEIETALKTEENSPISFLEVGTRLRSWKRGRLATLEVRVLFRQRNSWQGILTWAEGEQRETFGSVWDLIRQMDRILSKNSKKTSECGDQEKLRGELRKGIHEKGQTV